VGGLADRVRACADEGSLARALLDTTSLLGAERSFFVVVFRALESGETYRFLLACDPRWYFDYEEANLFADDPWITYARYHAEPAMATESSDPVATAATAAVLIARSRKRSMRLAG